MEEKLYPVCAKCSKIVCQPKIKVQDVLSLGEAPEFCPMKANVEILNKAREEYQKEKIKEFARLASIQEFECYEHTPYGIRTTLPRIEELIRFAKKCGYKRLGLAFCNGLNREARLLAQILENKGFEVISVRCKVGGVPKEEIGIRPEQKIRGHDNWESMCNPIAQAMILNKEEVDLAVLLGLCIGHDTLFLKYCQVPVTVLAVKDRVTGHNPLAALYLSDSIYYNRLMAKE